MAYLSNAQRNLLAPAGPHPRNGATVPTSDQPPFVNAACWAWALSGAYENVGGAFTANTIYNGDDGAFVFNAQRVPTGLNPHFFAMTDELFPQSVAYHATLNAQLANALGGDVGAQDLCRVALMKLTAVVNGHTVLPDDGAATYTMVMKSSSWYGWDHWAIGVQNAAGDVTTYQQKVTETPLQYNCGVVWDEHQPLDTEIRLDGLLQAQVDMLNNVV